MEDFYQEQLKTDKINGVSKMAQPTYELLSGE